MDVELEVIAIERVLREVQEVVRLALELLDDQEELLDHVAHAVDVRVRRQRRELHDRAVQVEELVAALDEELKLDEDPLVVEIKLPPLRLLREALLRRGVLFLVPLLHLDAQAHLV